MQGLFNVTKVIHCPDGIGCETTGCLNYSIINEDSVSLFVCVCVFIFQLGSVACSPVDCVIFCTYPFHPEGECCPVCHGKHPGLRSFSDDKEIFKKHCHALVMAGICHREAITEQRARDGGCNQWPGSGTWYWISTQYKYSIKYSC